jgi:hypothetical protein
MTFKKKQAVKFRTRSDRPLLRGTVIGSYGTSRGEFITIRGTDGQERNVRPAYVTAA